ncbi:MAG: hypothetical protein E7Z96_02530 [Actinomycetaceae bacterium]|nr:hypothetical protein [Actinomycetaceae bacterium]
MSTNNTTSPTPQGEQYPEYPESKKLSAASEYILEILNFLEWAEEHNIILSNRDRSYFSYENATEDLVRAYYGIDKTLLEMERRHMTARLNDTLTSIDGGDAA